MLIRELHCGTVSAKLGSICARHFTEAQIGVPTYLALESARKDGAHFTEHLDDVGLGVVVLQKVLDELEDERACLAADAALGLENDVRLDVDGADVDERRAQANLLADNAWGFLVEEQLDELGAISADHRLALWRR